MLVIGESSRRQNFSLYGYSKNTNPLLSTIHNLHHFDANSSATYTTAGVKSILLPYGATGPDYLSMVPHFLENTSSIKFMMALRPYALTPEYAVKSYQTIAQNLKYKYPDLDDISSISSLSFIYCIFEFSIL